MARQNGVHFIGRIGNVVGSTWKGIPYLRYMPDKIKQSEATKQSGANMALASRMGAAFRKSFESQLPQPKDRLMQNRFTGAIKKWLQTKPFEETLPAAIIPYLTGFDFNESSPIDARFRVSITVGAETEQPLQLQMASFVPKQNITAPPGTETVSINIAVANCHIDSRTIKGYYFDRIHFSYNNDTIPARLISLPYSSGMGSIDLVLISLQYYTSKGMITNPRWLPCGLVTGHLQ